MCEYINEIRVFYLCDPPCMKSSRNAKSSFKTTIGDEKVRESLLMKVISLFNFFRRAKEKNYYKH